MGAGPSSRDAAARALTAGSFAVGALLLASVLAALPGEVFNSGDGGLQSLQARQAAAGDLAAALHLPAEPWAERLWRDGFYPFRPPFVYATPDGPVPVYPVLFPWLAAPLYRLLGWPGLYLVAALGALLVWEVFRRGARRLGAPPLAAAAGLAALVLASPLTLYGAMVYAHTWAALLLLASCVVAVASRLPGPAAMLLAGAAAGLAPALRSESWCLTAGLAGLAALRWRRERDRRWTLFLAGLALAAVAFLAFNRWRYGLWLGAHGAQVVMAVGWREQAARGLAHAAVLGRSLAITFPTGVLAGVLAAGLVARRAAPPEVRRLAALAAWTALSVPFVLPVAEGLHWGPRFLLLVVPLLALLLALVLPRLAGWPALPRRLAWVALVASALAGAWLDGVVGPRELRENYRTRVWPTLEAVRATGWDVVVVDDQYVSLELASLLDEKAFFLAGERGRLERLVAELAARGVGGFAYVLQPYGRAVHARVAWAAGELEVRCAAEPGEATMPVYDCRIGRRPAAAQGR